MGYQCQSEAFVDLCFGRRFRLKVFMFQACTRSRSLLARDASGNKLEGQGSGDSKFESAWKGFEVLKGIRLKRCVEFVNLRFRFLACFRVWECTTFEPIGCQII